MNIQSAMKHIHNGTFRARTKEKLNEIISDWIRHYRRCFPIKSNRIVIDNFAGRGYADHPRYIAEEIHQRGLKWDIVWLVDNINEPMPDWIRKVRYRSWRSVYELTTARYWVDNIRNAHLVPKKEGQIYLQTWHGPSMTIKQLEKEAEKVLSPGYIEAAKYDGSITDAIISCSAIQSKQYRDSFWLSSSTEILEVGGPRSDCFFNKDYLAERNDHLREMLNIGKDTYLILYAPTFRDDGSTAVYHLDFEAILDAFRRKTKKQCKILMKLHPNVPAGTQFSFNENLLDGSSVSDSNDALICADCLISDFSSMLYDAALMDIVSFRHALDYDAFLEQRPAPLNRIEWPFLISKSTDELTRQIETVDFQEYQTNVRNFMKTIKTFDDGRATKRTVDWLEKKYRS